MADSLTFAFCAELLQRLMEHLWFRHGGGKYRWCSNGRICSKYSIHHTYIRHTYRISLNNILHSNFKNAQILIMFLFYVLSFFKKGDTIQGGTLLKGEHYLRKYSMHLFFSLYYTCILSLICLSMYLDYYLLFRYIFITFESEKT